MMHELKNILAINFGGIGDEILFLPTISSLKKAFPDAKLTLCLEPRSACVKDLTNLIDDVICTDIKRKNKYIEILKLIIDVRRKKFDLVVSSGGNSLIAIMMFLMGIRYRIGYQSGSLSKLLLTEAVKLNKSQYAGEMYHDLVKNITKQAFEPPQIITPEVDIEQRSVVVHPGVSKMSVDKKMVKTISAQGWADVVKGLLNKGWKVYLAGGRDDEECINTIKGYLSEEEKTSIVDLFGKTKNLMEFAQIVARTGNIVCSDSAPMHIGVGVGARTVAIFGPTDETKLMPKSEKFIAVKTSASCRPCLFDIRQTTCDTLECLQITSEQILSYFD